MISGIWNCLKEGHEYSVELQPKDKPSYFVELNFQDGTVPEVGHNGLTNEVVLEILINRMKFLNGKFPSRENSIVITKLQESLMWLNARTIEREERGVEGKHVI